MIPRRIPIKGSRNNGPGNITHPRANPLTLRVTPDAGAVPVTGSGLLRAEIRASRTDDNTPLATVQMTNPEGSGPWEITFSGAQMNQQLDGKASKQCWLVVYLLDSAGQRDTLHTANLTITEDGASLASELPPDVETLLDRSTADNLYATLPAVDALASAIAAPIPFPARLREAVMSGAYTLTSNPIPRDSDGMVLSSNVLWPDGTTGVFTTTSKDPVHLTAASYTITYNATPIITITQPAIERDDEGNVIRVPNLIIS